MSSTKPKPGRCGARTRDGRYCANYPVDGRNRCRMHGGGRPGHLIGRPITHGMRSKQLAEAAREIRLKFGIYTLQLKRDQIRRVILKYVPMDRREACARELEDLGRAEVGTS